MDSKLIEDMMTEKDIDFCNKYEKQVKVCTKTQQKNLLYIIEVLTHLILCKIAYMKLKLGF